MELHILDFRGYDDVIFVFPENGIIQLRGDSGCGKSTVFYAILWVLYGKLQNITPKSNPKAKTCVKLKLANGVKIRRSRAPKELTFRHNKKSTTLFSDVAQNEIYKIFGEMDTFLSTSINEQDEKHPLICSDAKRRMKILNQVAFDNEDPIAFIQKLTDLSHTVETDLEKIEKKYINVKSRYKTLNKNQKPTKYNTILTKDEKSHYNKRIKEIDTELVSYNAILEKETYKWKSYLQLNKQYTSINTKLEDVILDDIRSEYKNAKQLYLSNIENNKIVQSIKTLESSITPLSKTTRPSILLPEVLSSDEIATLEYEYKVYNTNLSLANEIPIKYDEVEIGSRIEHIQSLIHAQSLLLHLDRKDELEREIKALVQVELPNESEDELRLLLQANEKQYKEDISSVNNDRLSVKSKYKALITEFNTEHNNKLSEELSILEVDYKNKKKNLTTIYQDSETKYRTELDSMKNELSILNMSKDIVVCPGCYMHLRYVSNGLDPSSNIVSPSLQTATLNPSIKKYVVSQSLQTATLQPSDLNTFDNEKYENVKSEIANLTNKIDQIKKQYNKESKVLDTEYNTGKDSISSKYKTSKSTFISDINKQEQEELAILDTKQKHYTSNYNQNKDKYESMLKLHSKYAKIEATRVTLQKELESLSVICDSDTKYEKLTKSQIVSYKNELNKLSKIVVVPKPAILPDDAKQSNNWYKTQEKIANLTKELEELKSKLINVDSIVSQAELQALKKKYKKTVSLIEDYKRLSSEIKKLGDVTNPETTSSIIDKLNSEKEDIKLRIEDSRRTEVLTKALDKKTTLKEKKTNLVRKAKDIQKMIKLANVTQYEVYGDLINSLNNFIQTCSPLLFDKSIFIKICQVKTLKKGTDKNNIHLNIIYDGVEFDDIKSFSGGEKRRISVLISMAFNHVFGSRIMIFDESISCLNVGKRDALLKLIQETMSDRLVLMTCHECHTGYFDQIIDVSQ